MIAVHKSTFGDSSRKPRCYTVGESETFVNSSGLDMKLAPDRYILLKKTCSIRDKVVSQAAAMTKVHLYRGLLDPIPPVAYADSLDCSILRISTVKGRLQLSVMNVKKKCP
jgi:hypothetical protein